MNEMQHLCRAGALLSRSFPSIRLLLCVSKQQLPKEIRRQDGLLHRVVAVPGARHQATKQVEAIGGTVRAAQQGNAPVRTGRAAETNEIQKTGLAREQLFRVGIKGDFDAQVADGQNAGNGQVGDANFVNGRQGKDGQLTVVGGYGAKVVFADAELLKGARVVQGGEDGAGALAGDKFRELFVDQSAGVEEQVQKGEEKRQNGTKG